MRIGMMEALLVFGVILLMFGPKKLPELARSMGEAMREFKKGQKEIDESLNKTVNLDVDEHKNEEEIR